MIDLPPEPAPGEDSDEGMPEIEEIPAESDALELSEGDAHEVIVARGEERTCAQNEHLKQAMRTGSSTIAGRPAWGASRRWEKGAFRVSEGLVSASSSCSSFRGCDQSVHWMAGAGDGRSDRGEFAGWYPRRD